MASESTMVNLSAIRLVAGDELLSALETKIIWA
jgi:hypothetical protein